MSAHLPRFAVVLALSASFLVSSPASTSAATRLPGIDVSKWQGAIDWSTVATTNTRFVIVRATRGTAYQDPTFVANVNGARSHGIEVGAYHRATPRKHKDGTADLTDATHEADHYLEVAEPGFGDIIPALDIEQTGGMVPAQLIAWVKRWVSRVTNQLGVHPMLYASPHFWTANMGDTTWFADHGYRLWIAHWDAPSPDVPANDWQGAGWTFWQWTVKPGLPGIDGDLDRDRFRGTNLTTAEISRLTVQTGDGGSVSDATGRLSCGDGASCDAIYDPSAMVTLTATADPGAVLLSWDGVCAGAGSSPTCVATIVSARKATATFGYPVTVSRAGPGDGTVTSTPPGLSCPPVCSHAFRAGTTVSLEAVPDASSEFDSWSGACSGTIPTACSVFLDRPRAVTATFADQGPPSVDVDPPGSTIGALRFAFSEPVHGIDEADLLIKVASGPVIPAALVCHDADAERVSCEDGPVLTAALKPSEPLVVGQSYVAIANPNGASATIVDRADNPLPETKEPFRAPTDVTEAVPGAAFRWGTRDDARALGGSYRFERRPGAAATFTFSGPSVTLWTVAGPAFGRTRIEIDGSFRTTVDRDRSSFALVPKTFSGLGHGDHKITAMILDAEPGHPTGTGIDAITDRNGTRRSPATARATWGIRTAAGADGGRYGVSGVASAEASLRFRGTAVSLRTVTGPAFGRARIWVDGTLHHVDLSAPTTTYGVLWTVTGLDDRVHTIRVQVVGTAGKDGSGTNVALDGWLVT
jgi:lysozyme